jgi:hypothetical protein
MNGTAVTGYTANTPNNLVIDAGAVYTNYGLANEALAGATSGGNEFNAKFTFRQPKIDGIKSDNVKGLQILSKTNITLKVNFLEMTIAILQMALNGVTDAVSNPNYTIITGKTVITNADYLNNIAIVGTLSGTTLPVIIILKNALSLEGLSLKTEDEKDNVLPVTFTAHVDPSAPNVMPFEIRYPTASIVGLPFAVIGTPVIDNTKIQITFSDTVAAAVFKDGFTAKVNGVANVITAITRGVNQLNTVLLTLTTPPTAGQAVTIEYLLPLAGVRIKSITAVELQTFAATTVTNN